MASRQNRQQNPASARDRIHSRLPTGKVTWPCILVEGEEKAGKTWLAYELSKSERIGEAFAIDLGEGSADEYGPIGQFEILVADPDNPHAPWTFAQMLDQVRAVRDFAREELEAGHKPVLLMIDTMSDEWGILVDAIAAKASRSDANQRKLAEDPAAEVKIPNHLWNDANAKHGRLMTLLLTFPGIVVMTARGKDVAEIKNGTPVEGSKVWRVEGQHRMAYQASTWIRMRRNSEPTLEGCRSRHIGLRPGIDASRDLRDIAQDLGHERASFRERGLEWFVFDALQLDPENAAVRNLDTLTDDGEPMDGGHQTTQSVDQVYARVQQAWNYREGLAVLFREIEQRGYGDAQVTGPDSKTHRLLDLVYSRGTQLAAAEAVREDQNGAQDPADPETGESGGGGDPESAASGPESPSGAPDSDPAADDTHDDPTAAEKLRQAADAHKGDNERKSA